MRLPASNPGISPARSTRGETQTTPTDSPLGRAFAGVFGLFLAVALLKWGNPVVLDHLVEWPGNVAEWRVFAWPMVLGWLGLALVVLLAGPLVRTGLRERGPWFLLAALVGWWLWQGLATGRSIDPQLSRRFWFHFTACIVCFALGHVALRRVEEPRTFWLCLGAGFLGVLGTAMHQHFGGLEETRRMILETTPAEALPPEYLARITGGRVFGTLVYPNALAGVILLLLPLLTVWVWDQVARRDRLWAFGVAVMIVLAGLAVLTWSGSKAGWLLALGMGAVACTGLPVSRRTKVAGALVLVVGGLAGFGVLYAERLSRGATSVTARFDYWQAAVAGAAERPVLGHGPGAFKRVYARLKRPESEMAQLAHNDYLQQATDSGLPGALAYVVGIWGILGRWWWQRRSSAPLLEKAVALGVAGWFAQGLVEFGLYIPASAWCAFALLGWLCHPASTVSRSGSARASSPAAIPAVPRIRS